MCETPKSPPGDYKRREFRRAVGCELYRVKHLNPRQGITSLIEYASDVPIQVRVKHLNPRQGITRRESQETGNVTVHGMCETPKSPPGDYKTSVL